MAELSNQGMLQKAVIEIINEKPEEIRVSEANARSMPGVSTKNLNNKAANALKDGNSGAAFGSGNETVRFVVQFNPSELKINAEGEEESKSYIADAAGTGNNMETRQLSSRARVNFKLIFDDTDNEDAFLSESRILHPERLNQNMNRYLKSPGQLMNGEEGAKSGKTRIVRRQVEGLLAALRSEYTRKVRFVWGKLSYSGILNTLQAEYTMFNPKGEPVRAEVTIGILCIDEKLGQGNMGQWHQHYESFAGSLKK